MAVGLLLTACLPGITTTLDTVVFGVVGKSARLPCSLPVHQNNMEWVEYVYNTNHDPQKIYSSENNAAFAVDESHHNARDYRVEDDAALTISNLTFSDSGRYVCRSRANSTIYIQQSYYLNIGCEHIRSITYFL